MDLSGDDIAEAVLKQFDDLPAKAKPLDRGNGVREWVPLSGIVAQGRNSLTCLAAATGMKCLPQDKVPRAQGIVLHDWHAEVLAIRSFNRFLLDECRALISQKNSSDYLRIRDESERTETHFQPFALQDGINLHMYCSEAPCGDASMELTMAAQEDSTPWTIHKSPYGSTDDPPISPPASSSSELFLDTTTLPTTTPDTPTLHGRGFFSELGTVRRKPSRPDAPPTLSKSCSDKLALKQCTSLLSSITSMLISPSNLYLSSLVLPESQHSETACTRAFSPSGRMKEMKDRQWSGGYRFQEFGIKTSTKEFKYSRRQVLGVGEKLVPSTISASWIVDPTTKSGKLETLIGGVLQGRRQYDVRGASRVCKRRMWKLAIEVARLAAVPAAERCLQMLSYAEVKSSDCLAKRRSVKEDVRTSTLKRWVRNVGGEEFGIHGIEA